jgi:ABC-type branched-subunit amino acid transport system ATPase component
MALLEVSGLRAGYGKIDILHDVDSVLEAGT